MARRKHRQFYRHEVQEIVRRYKGGEPSTTIAIDYDVAGNSILAVLRQEGVVIRPSTSPSHNPTPEEIRLATHEIREGWDEDKEVERGRDIGRVGWAVPLVRDPRPARARGMI